MADIVLSHSAKGTSWQKKDASYIKREKKNGKWVYTYNNHNVPSNTSISNREKDMNKPPRYDYIDREGKLHIYLPQSEKVLRDKRSDIETDKRKSVSAQRNVQKDTRYKINTKTAYLKNKASRNINKGKKKVSELLERLKKKVSTSVTKAKKKASANISKAKKALNNKVQKAVQKEAKAYITNISTGETREAPTDLFENAHMKTKISLRKNKRKS